MFTPPTIDRPDLYRRLTNAKEEIKLAADYWDDSALYPAQLNLAFSACNSLLVIAHCLLSITVQRDQPETQ